MVDFKEKVSINRYFSRKVDNIKLDEIINALESDRGRIINSAAVRRLQQKTQVFPLEKNAAVRSRLTHSLEVQQTGRFIVKSIFKELSKNVQLVKEYNFSGLEPVFETLIEMACILHDIGNPPFGHFGEYAINNWFKENLDQIFPTDCHDYDFLKRDLKNFEGNAQAIRLITNVMSLNLTYSQIASILKYVRPAYKDKEDYCEGDSKVISALIKKPGFYWSEEKIINKLYVDLGMHQNCRYPLVYIMEAADDISYGIADIEDAVEKGILNLKQLVTKLKETYEELINDANKKYDFDSNIQVYNVKEKKVESKSFNQLIDSIYIADGESFHHLDDISVFFINFRVKIIHILVYHAAQQFINNLPAIYNGTLNRGLMDEMNAYHLILETLKSVTRRYVFNHSEVRTLEIKGYRIVHGLLECYKPVLELTEKDFSKLIKNIVKGENNRIDNRLADHLTHRLGSKQIQAYEKAIENLIKEGKYCLELEFYYRCRLLQDYISGMTDQFAHDEYCELMICNQ